MSTSNTAGINSLITLITKLDGLNYYDWIFDIEMVARQAGMWEVLCGEPKPDKLQDAAEWEQKSNDMLTVLTWTEGLWGWCLRPYYILHGTHQITFVQRVPWITTTLR
jgi:hypothetical protein